MNSDSSSCVYSSWTHLFLILQAWFNLVCMCTLLTDQRTHRAFQSDHFEVSSKARRWLPDRLGWEDWCSPHGLQGITTSIYQAFTILSPFSTTNASANWQWGVAILMWSGEWWWRSWPRDPNWEVRSGPPSSKYWIRIDRHNGCRQSELLWKAHPCAFHYTQLFVSGKPDVCAACMHVPYSML